MSPDLPEPIAKFFAAQASGDHQTLTLCFTADASVRDEGRQFRGPSAIAQWMADAKEKYAHTAEPLAMTQRDGKLIVATRLTGVFPGSPIEDSVATRNAAAIHGVTFARPPISDRSRVWVRS